MNSEPINQESSTRICNHMNKDHKDAVNAYAKYYGKIKTFKSAEMISLSQKSIQLKIDDTTLEIKFDHVLKDCSDAHKTLVRMIKAIPSS
jgi:putative heme iron utilization protein